MNLKDALLCGGFSLALPIGQTLFKWAALYNEKLDGPLPMRLVSNGPLIGAFAYSVVLGDIHRLDVDTDDSPEHAVVPTRAVRGLRL